MGTKKVKVTEFTCDACGTVELAQTIGDADFNHTSDDIPLTLGHKVNAPGSRTKWEPFAFCMECTDRLHEFIWPSKGHDE